MCMAHSPAVKTRSWQGLWPSTEAHQSIWCNEGLREETGCFYQTQFGLHSLLLRCVKPSFTTESPFTAIQAAFFFHNDCWRLKYLLSWFNKPLLGQRIKIQRDSKASCFLYICLHAALVGKLEGGKIGASQSIHALTSNLSSKTKLILMDQSVHTHTNCIYSWMEAKTFTLDWITERQENRKRSSHWGRWQHVCICVCW